MKTVLSGMLALCSACSSGACAGHPRGSASESHMPAPERAPVPAPEPASGPAGARPARAQPSPARAALAAVLKRLRKGGAREVVYRVPEAAEHSAYGRRVRELLVAARADREPPAQPESHDLQILSGGRLWVLAERQELRAGGGAVVLRRGPAAELIVEAPHTFFDAGTLPIAVAVFDALSARALLINTAHRAALANDRDEDARDALARAGELASDAAHAERSLFGAAHGALVAGLGGGPALQLHGYRDAKETAFQAIVSAADSPFDVGPLTDRLRAALPGTAIAAFPRDTRRLGGMRNVQAAASRAFGAPFVHIELSRSLRDRLLSEPQLLESFARVFGTLAVTREVP